MFFAFCHSSLGFKHVLYISFQWSFLFQVVDYLENYVVAEGFIFG